jgi:hypothetical protein
MVARLGPLVEALVFLGGCATGLLLTDPAAPPIRATVDVDVIVGVGSLVEYHRLAERLRERGFAEDQAPHAPICRWTVDGMLLDVMPTRDEILGFGNPWYQQALETATTVALPSGVGIGLVSAPCFLATKLAAFDSRGQGDHVMSHDLEDVVSVLDGRVQIVTEVAGADQPLREFLQERLRQLLADANFIDALPGHLPGDPASQSRLPILLGRIRAIVEA